MHRLTLSLAALSVGTLIAGPAAALSPPNFRASVDSWVEGVPPLQATTFTCQGGAPYQNGSLAASEYSKGTGWMWGGILLPLIGLIALGAGPSQPPPGMLSTIAEADRQCFIIGYQDQSRSNKKRSGLIGGGIGLALNIALISAVGSD